ncbi:MAG: hypothetical protein CMH83_07885 [Nocardioides sp.]|nr:hypothetical protein [Nocardioides sp.]
MATGLAGLVVLSAPTVVHAATPVGDSATVAPLPSDPTDPLAPGGPRPRQTEPQTSDGIAGEIAPLAGAESFTGRRSTRAQTSIRRRWTPAKGVRATVWDEHDSRGRIRAYLLSVDYRVAGLSIDYGNAGKVARTDTVMDIAKRDRGVIAAVNGDFFDIGDTGAPLGTGRAPGRGLLNGRYEGWNRAFLVDRNGRPDIDEVTVSTSVRHFPQVKVNHVNSPEVLPGKVGVYTSAWGRTSGYRWTGGQKKQVRMVVVRNGRVVKNSTRLPQGTLIKGKILVGRGPGAKALVPLKRGRRASVKTVVFGTPRMAITGNVFLVRDGVIKAIDDTEMHPRTAIGIDYDTHRVLMLVIDGRQRFSRGYTMVELADKMIELGADEALNLDGGGSSTMIARRDGKKVVVNSPSDGFQRRVANTVEVRYTRPRG